MSPSIELGLTDVGSSDSPPSPPRLPSTVTRATQLGGRISGDTASDACLFKVMQWILDCLGNHIDCGIGLGRPSILPRRLLYLDAAFGDDPFAQEKEWTPRLIETKSLEPEHLVPKYVFLSYCWGGTHDMLTTKVTLKDMMAGIPWDAIPKTFQDVITVTRQLGVRYLWIDALCIIQDDSEDWQREAGRMADIYAGAYFTISAMRSENCRGGLFSKSPFGDAPVRAVTLLESPSSGPMLYVQQRLPHMHMGYREAGNDSEAEKARHPLITRGWVLQERLHSRRILHFLHHEVVWEYKQIKRCECGRLNSSNTFRLASSDKFSFDEWHRLVEKYSELEISFEKDRLPALSGLAKQFQERMKYRYLAGLWESDLCNELRWRIESLHDRSTPDSSGRRTARTVDYISPSWSWASITGTFQTLYQFDGYQTSKMDSRHIRLLEAVCKPLGDDPTGQVKEAYLRITGRIAPCRLIYPQSNDDSQDKFGDLISTFGTQEECPSNSFVLRFQEGNIAFLPDYPPNQKGRDCIEEGERLFCLRLGKLLYEEKRYVEPSGRRQRGYTTLVPTSKNGDLLVLRYLDSHIPETSFYADMAGSPVEERWMYTFERVGLVPHFRISEEREGKLFEGRKELLIKII